ncbi:hypothetical protein HNP67_001054 [Borreliella californiensis]|uniref:Uncharacterized protein n=1 Tax=Borreliella californiensis TaxID=373543 RepID=A0A7W9ZL42_9SPIR|nr:hypothetical protein [Borreliella californiensis]MBB6213559.1 hypothetical protein [Borreliella californiensis]
MDTDAAPIYNNYENGNSMTSKQASVNQKQEQKKDKFYYYGVFKEAVSNMTN